MAVGKKVVVSMTAMFLVVGAVIGSIAVIDHIHGGDKDGEVNTSNKAVTSMCESTQYKESCMDALSTTAKNETATIKDYVKAIVQSTVDSLKKGLEETLSVKKAVEESKTKTPADEIIFKECEDNLKYALEDLEELIIKTVDETTLENMGKHAYDLRVWLTMIDVYQETCLDNIRNEEQKKVVENALRNSTELTRAAVDIIYGLGDILNSLGIPQIDLDALMETFASSKSRKLLGEIEVDHDGYPSWLHPNDRKLLAAPVGPPPNATVAKDGSGQFKTIKEALATYPKNKKKIKGRFVVYVKAGVYDEIVMVEKYMKNVFMYGDGRGKTIITGNKNEAKMKAGASATSTFSALGMGFLAKSMTFRNTAGHVGHQAVALRITGDHSAVFDCSIEGFQDTLYYHGNRQFYKNCAIYGTIDFIFGSGVCLIQDSDIFVRKGGPTQANMVTADGTIYPHETSALVLQNVRIKPDVDLFPTRLQVSTYLGRPWKPFCKTVIMQSELGDLIRPEGYIEWDIKVMHQKTATYLEYANRGPGANTASRVKWPNVRVIDRNEALKYTANTFLDRDFDKNVGPWLQQTGFPYNSRLAA